MSLRQSKHQFYKGADFEKPASITFDFKRVDAKKISTWSALDKRRAKKWLKRVREYFSLFVDEAVQVIDNPKKLLKP